MKFWQSYCNNKTVQFFLPHMVCCWWASLDRLSDKCGCQKGHELNTEAPDIRQAALISTRLTVSRPKSQPVPSASSYPAIFYPPSATRTSSKRATIFLKLIAGCWFTNYTVNKRYRALDETQMLPYFVTHEIVPHKNDITTFRNQSVLRNNNKLHTKPEVVNECVLCQYIFIVL